MDIIILNGGMGNQMFQYALYKTLEYRGKKVCIDEFRTKNRNSLINDFHIKYKSLPYYKSYILSKEINNQFLAKLKFIFEYIFIGIHNYQWEEYVFKKEMLEYKNTYYDGYFQSEQFFPDKEVQDQLRKEFVLPSNYKKSNEFIELEKEVKSCESVSIHYRRTDYLYYSSLYGNICTEDYYNNAIEYILQRYPDAKFYVFSDDKKYIKEKYGDKFVIVNEDKKMSDLEEFFIMSYCKHNIIANSTYSWWAAWLNDNPDAIILAPEKWLNGYGYDYIYTDRMIKIKS